MESTLIVGILASVSQAALILWGGPHQAYLMWKNKSAENISVQYIGLIFLSCIAWLAYGILLNNPIIYIPQIIALPCAGAKLYFCWLYRPSENATAVT